MSAVAKGACAVRREPEGWVRYFWPRSKQALAQVLLPSRQNCGFYSFEQCMANAWGNGGFCRRNAFEDPYWTGRTTYRRYRRGD
jgi:hypothetical protein